MNRNQGRAVGAIQTYLTLLSFADTASFYKFKICGNSASGKSIGAIFPTVFVHFISPCHILVILTIFQTFSLLLLYYIIIFVMLYLSSVTFRVTTKTH